MYTDSLFAVPPSLVSLRHQVLGSCAAAQSLTQRVPQYESRLAHDLLAAVCHRTAPTATAPPTPFDASSLSRSYDLLSHSPLRGYESGKYTAVTASRSGTSGKNFTRCRRE